MLVIDDREDTQLLRALSPYDISVTTARLEYGDCQFEGRGPHSRPVLIGWERKHLSDLIDSMQSGRLSGHQLRGMWSHYDYCYLVIEDRWRGAPSGEIEMLTGPKLWRSKYPGTKYSVSYRQLDSYIASLELRGNVIVCRTETVHDTAALYVSRYLGWQKPWDAHHSHDQIHPNDLTAPPTRGRARLTLSEPGLIEKMAAQLPGIDRKAWDVGRHFPSIQAMVLASEKEWQQIPGIGPGIAKKVVEALNKEKL